MAKKEAKKGVYKDFKTGKRSRKQKGWGRFHFPDGSSSEVIPPPKKKKKKKKH